MKQRNNTTVDSTKLKLSKIFKQIAESIKPQPIPDFDDWADENITIPSESSSQPGKWNTDLFPFWHEPMKAMTPTRSARELTFLKGSQIAYTTVLVARTLYISKVYPSPHMLTQPTKETAKDFSKTKWKPFAQTNKSVATTFGRDVPKGYTSTILTHTYPGGFFIMGSLVDSNFTKGKSVRYLDIDEEDSADTLTKDDGFAIEVAMKRQNSFPDRLTIRGGTPKILETSTNHKAYLRGTQEKYYMPCPHCNREGDITKTYFYFHHELFKLRGKVSDDFIPDEVYIECENCGEEIHEEMKAWLMSPKRARWLMEDEDGDLVECPPHLKKLHRSFYIPSYYSPQGFLSWRDAFKDYCKYMVTRDFEDYRVYRNQIEGLPVSLTGEDSISKTELLDRVKKSSYGGEDTIIPKGVLAITMGIDVQGNRVEGEILGHGMYREKYSLGYVVIYGDTSILGDNRGLDAEGNPTVYKKLADVILNTQYKHESGCYLPIEQTFMDAGFETENVHRFCKSYERFGVFPCRGRAGWDKGMIIFPKKPHESYGTQLYYVMKDPMIKQVYGDLSNLVPGAGFQHFPHDDAYGANYFKGLVSERLEEERKHGQNKLKWVTPSGLRNEPIDVRCYAIGAFIASGIQLGVRYNRKYPLSESVLSFWKKPEEPRLVRKHSATTMEGHNPVQFMPPVKKYRRKTKTLRNTGARMLSKGMNK